MLEYRVYQRIKETGQDNYFLDNECEIEPDFLYLGYVYEAVSMIVPKSYKILDLGCYMCAQAFLFERFKEYIGVDSYDIGENPDGTKVPRRFKTLNSTMISESIEDFLKSNKCQDGKVYVIMSAVPCKADTAEKVISSFKNVTVNYPGKEGIYKGIYADEIQKITEKITSAYCPFSQKYLNSHPSEVWKQAKIELNTYKEIREIINAVKTQQSEEKND